MTLPWVLGFDIGGTRLKSAAIGPDQGVLRAGAVLVDGSEFPRVLDQMVRLADASVEDLGGPPQGIGVAIPGLVQADVGAAVLPGRTAGLAGFPLVETLAARFGVPVVCLNDGTAAVLGEWRAGAGRGHRNVACLTLGTGVGGGAIVDGSPVGDLDRGLGSYLGHMSMERDGDPCVCGNTGCAETLLSPNAMVGRVRAAITRAVPTALTDVARAQGGVLTFEDIVDWQRRGDPLCVAVIERFTRDLSRFLVSICHVLAPEVIVVGGGAAQACEDVLVEARALLATHAFVLPGAVPVVAPSTLGDLAGVHGACAEMWRRLAA